MVLSRFTRLPLHMPFAYPVAKVTGRQVACSPTTDARSRQGSVRPGQGYASFGRRSADAELAHGRVGNGR